METIAHNLTISSAKLIILEDGKARTVELMAQGQWAVGRYSQGDDPNTKICLTSQIASREHGWFFHINNEWYYGDSAHNTNGTFYNGRKIPRSVDGKQNYIKLQDGDVLRIDNSDLDHFNKKGVLLMFTTATIRGQWKVFPLEQNGGAVIGRSRSCDITVALPYLSAKHAVITARDGKYYLADANSKAGTYLNRSRVTAPTLLREKDCIALCDYRVFFLDNTLVYEDRGIALEQPRRTAPVHSRPVVLKADIATKQVKDLNGSGTKELIRDIHLNIREGSLVALLGTAGAGKSTVMNCLNGMDLEGVQGAVVYRNVDLMQNFDQMKSMIGSVPQQKVFHKTFTPEQEFRFAARKRLPGDTSSEEITERVNSTIRMLSMEGVRKNRNSKLSGGEQTRVNVGIELVADRDFLCLDEPDQGLSPNYKHELFEIMRNLAHQNGKTVLSIIHDVSEIDMFDQVIMLAKKDGVGRLAFSGSPAEAREFFGVDIRDAYALLEKNPGKYVR